MKLGNAWPKVCPLPESGATSQKKINPNQTVAIFCHRRFSDHRRRRLLLLRLLFVVLLFLLLMLVLLLVAIDAVHVVMVTDNAKLLGVRG